jgi:uncharacterized membrane protein YGL010W
MRTFNQWMDEYGVSHKNPTNQFIHKICVPLIMLTVIGFLWLIPVPEAFERFAFLNWATIFTTACLFFYLSLSFSMFLGMLILSTLMCAICYQLNQLGILLEFSLVVFILAWAGQFYGHKIEGKKPSFLQDLAFLLIGPLWVLRFFYTKLGFKI